MTDFYSFYIILIIKNSTCDCSKIYHISLKNCKNRLRLAKVIVQNKMSRFFMVNCVYGDMMP